MDRARAGLSVDGPMEAQPVLVPESSMLLMPSSTCSNRQNSWRTNRCALPRKPVILAVLSVSFLALLVLRTAVPVRDTRWTPQSAALDSQVVLNSEADVNWRRWQVVFQAGNVNVRKTPSLAAVIVAKHWKCDIVEGVEEDGWVKLTDEPGYLKISFQSNPLLKQVPSFRKIQKGTCDGLEMFPIHDKGTCLKAAQEVGFNGVEVQWSEFVPSPEGCYIQNGKVWLGTDPANRGNGVIGGRLPLCSSVEAPYKEQQCTPISGAPNEKEWQPRKDAHQAGEGELIKALEADGASAGAESAAPPADPSSSKAPRSKGSTESADPSVSTTPRSAGTVSPVVLPASFHAPARPSGKAHWPSLFCFEVVWVKPWDPNWYEPLLVKTQLQQHASIFQCDGYNVFSAGGTVFLGSNWTTQELKVEKPLVHGGSHDLDGKTSSWLNAKIFQRAWDLVRLDGHYRQHDWTVKVATDSVFFAGRLRNFVRPHTTPAGAWFYLNCDRHPASPPGQARLYGAVEVFSRKAVDAYMAGKDDCINTMEWKDWGEDYFMQMCLTELNVMAIHTFRWIGDDRCWPADCSAQDQVAFHPFKSIDNWLDCWRASTNGR